MITQIITFLCPLFFFFNNWIKLPLNDYLSWVEFLFHQDNILNILKQHAAAAKSLQSFPTLCDPIDGSPPGSPVPGILQARTLEWVAISFSKSNIVTINYENLSWNLRKQKEDN